MRKMNISAVYHFVHGSIYQSCSLLWIKTRKLCQCTITRDSLCIKLRVCNLSLYSQTVLPTNSSVQECNVCFFLLFLSSPRFKMGTYVQSGIFTIERLVHHKLGKQSPKRS